MINLPAITFLIVCASLAAFFYAVHMKWFSRLENGFLLKIILAVAGLAVLSALALGTWGYQAGKDIVHQEVVGALNSVGDVVEANLLQVIDRETEQLYEFARGLHDKLSPEKRKDLNAELFHIDRLSKEVLQIGAFDAKGNLLASSNVTMNAAEPVDRIAVAFALEGKKYISDAYVSPVAHRYVLIIAAPITNPQKTVVGALTIRYDLQSDLSNLISSTRFAGQGYAAVTNNEGRILAYPEASRIGADASSYPSVQEGRQGKSGWVVARSILGRRMLYVYRPLRSPATVNPAPWVLLTELDEAKAMAPIRTLGLRFLAGIGIIIIVCLVIARQVALSIQDPVEDLGLFVKKVQAGDLSKRIAGGGRDVLGRLGASLNEMVQGLQDRDRIKELFGRYVTTQVSDKIVKGEINLEGESRRVTILFSDIRGFTAMSEKMAPAQVVAFLNDYFSEMVEAVFAYGGVLDKFIGDGMMAVFGSMDDAPDHPRRAVLAALQMKARLSKINGDRSILGKPPITIGIGIHTDTVIVGNVGSRKRLEYTVIGDGVNTCSRVEALNKEFGTTILITETSYQAIKDEFECRKMPEQEIRGKTKPLAFYEVISVRTK